MTRILSIFVENDSTCIFKLLSQDEVITPLSYWQSKPGDRMVLKACEELSGDFSEQDYIVLNGILQEKETEQWQNTLKEKISDYGITANSIVVPPAQVASLRAALELAEAKNRLDTEGFEEWLKLEKELSSRELSVQSLAFLQGLDELQHPCKKGPFWGVSVPTVGGGDIVNQVQLFAGS